ncbi:heparan-alpha-glucosaminide N-acetyltransferase domain-containing protein [Isoptericola halotolerans]|uniref:Membrane protein YeiB n=1 Tax=Isoptericola halotolerans TaxID=300560 RepID=A0ABX2A7L0_9MICO|nr:heparan-alpha-glucosaminide N-acetyltransferase domain-containing protein [Isoptericola halotolerans]NOV98845.1 putative membrane protein YeiB [Isoptericola halotolerans]
MTSDDGAPDRHAPPAVRAAASWWERAGLRLRGGPGRVVGLDAARGLAVLGMFAAHVGVAEGPAAWLEVADGRSSILFALVAGVSLGVVTGGPRPLAGDRLVHARARLLVRAVLLLALVGLLDLLGTRVLLILGFYAAYFVLALPFLRWGPRRLAVAAAVVAVVGPPVAYWAPELLASAGLRPPRDGSGALTDFLLTGHYPAVVWMAYVLAGMAIGRCDLRSVRLRRRLVLGGLGATAVGYLVSAWWLARLEPESAAWHLAQAGPHDDTFLEVLGSGGFAMAVLGTCLYVGRVGVWALAPLAAVGAMALTVYSLQIVAIWRWDLVGSTTNGPLLAMVLVTLVVATLWRSSLGRGPLERVFAAVARRTAPPPREDRPAA